MTESSPGQDKQKVLREAEEILLRKANESNRWDKKLSQKIGSLPQTLFSIARRPSFITGAFIAGGIGLTRVDSPDIAGRLGITLLVAGAGGLGLSEIVKRVRNIRIPRYHPISMLVDKLGQFNESDMIGGGVVGGMAIGTAAVVMGKSLGMIDAGLPESMMSAAALGAILGGATGEGIYRLLRI
ncbi:hypothetical protein HYS94_04755 [Candidatus Daviesbacteria bacterium]|nr:hypothetical protein [Candidatus Daviesbacteria bacterium]